MGSHSYDTRIRHFLTGVHQRQAVRCRTYSERDDPARNRSLWRICPNAQVNDTRSTNSRHPAACDCQESMPPCIPRCSNPRALPLRLRSCWPTMTHDAKPTSAGCTFPLRDPISGSGSCHPRTCVRGCATGGRRVTRCLSRPTTRPGGAVTRSSSRPVMSQRIENSAPAAAKSRPYPARTRRFPTRAQILLGGERDLGESSRRGARKVGRPAAQSRNAREDGLGDEPGDEQADDSGDLVAQQRSQPDARR